MPGEFDFIQWLREQQTARPSNGMTTVGIGDDLAVLKWPAKELLLVGVDQVLDGVHFDSSVHQPRAIGRKVMNRNLSDCAAMGCRPAVAVVAVALSAGLNLEYAKELYFGLREAADPFDCEIVGGDTASWPGKLALTVTILGRTEKPVLRSGAAAGDFIYVTGPLGGSLLGRHMTFAPRVQLGLSLAPYVTSMIDLSDGISRDLGHICRASGVGAIIEADRVPIHHDAIAMSQSDRISPLEHALHDGEDYELLFTTHIESAIGTRIGRITESPGLWLQQPDGTRQPLQPKGWEHRL